MNKQQWKKATLSLAISWLIVGISARAEPAPPPMPLKQEPAPLTEAEFEYKSRHFMPASIEFAAAAPIYGLNFISNAEDMGAGRIDEQQYQNGLATGAKWNRWPLYWQRIEQSQNQFNWNDQDATIKADIEHGLKTNAILLGTPGFYQTQFAPSDSLASEPSSGNVLALSQMQTAKPIGLYDSVFTDGTDVPGGGKTINPNNKWARFVSMAVDRYKPGGWFAQANGWNNGQGITHWAMWNEPDLEMFWNASMPDYARLLKVGYIASKHSDPNAQVIFGAIANSHAHLNFFNEVMGIYDNDALAPSQSYYHDIFATHSYFNAWQSWYHVYRARNTLTSRGLDKPIWLDEMGVAAWSDYPGPVWDSASAYRSTLDEQANYLIQSTMYGLFAGADAIFPFQLYDGCGNQPAFTDFPPHNGELCDANGNLTTNSSIPCGGDAYGLFRNPTDALCFRQHPYPESPRPQFHAYKTVTIHLQNVSPLFRLRPYGSDPTNGPQEWIGFFRHDTKKRVIGMWARFGIDQVAEMPASDSWAQLVSPDGSVQSIAPQNGVYRINLPAATNSNTPGAPYAFAIGGKPYLLIEGDTKAPVVTGGGTRNGNVINLGWQGVDNYLGSGIQDYTVKVSVDNGGQWVWLNNVAQEYSAFSNANPGSTYRFYITTRDNAGNVSQTYVVTFPGDGSGGGPPPPPNLNFHYYFPIIAQY